MADPGLPGSAPLTLYRGDTRVWTVAFTTDDGDNLDLSGRTWVAQVRGDQDRGTLLATITVDTTDAATGGLTLTLPSSESLGLTTTDGRAVAYWDLQSDDSGVVTTWLAGKVKILGDVSIGDDDEVTP